MWRSIRTSAPAAANAPPSARPALPPTRCRPPTRCCASCARCSRPIAQAGGTRAIVLLHDEPHGAPLIEALARHGDGLPANVLPLAVNEVTQVGLEAVAAAFAYGASALRFLTRAKPRHDMAGLHKTIALAEPILAGLGFGTGRVATIETDDPFALGETLRAIAADRRRAASRRVHSRRREARRAAACAARTASRGACAGRCRGAARRRAVRHGRAQRRRLHALPLLRLGLPDRRAVRRCRSGRCCASPRMPACSAGCARRPAPRR